MAMAPLRSFGDLLRRSRLAAGFTLEELAERAGLSAKGIGALERGERRAPRRETVLLLAEALGLEGADLAQFETAARHRGMSAMSAMSAISATQTQMGAATATPHALGPPLVGRLAELARLEHHLAGEGPPVVCVSGEPGIGKTRLLRETAMRARNAGWTVLEDGCQRRGGQELYAPLLGALQRFLAHRSATQCRRDLQGCAWLVRLLPELAELAVVPAPTWTLSPLQEQRLMFAAVERLLANVAGPAGTLLLLDDLQWSGPDALALLAVLARAAAMTVTVAEPPLRLVVTYRSTEVGPQDALLVTLGDLARDGMAAHLPLEPLSPQEATDLLRGLLDAPGQGSATTASTATDAAATTTAMAATAATAATVEQVLRRAGGSPFFLVSCAQELRARGAIGKRAADGAGDGAVSADGTVTAAVEVPVPWSVAQSVRQRVAALPEVAQELVRAAAVVGRTVPGSLLAAMGHWPERDLLAGLEALCQARLLREGDAEDSAGDAEGSADDEGNEGDTDGGAGSIGGIGRAGSENTAGSEGGAGSEDVYQFAHDLIREVVMRDLSARRRKVLHRQVAEALERSGGEPPVEVLAFHYGQSDAKPQALFYLEQAAERATARHAHAEAEAHYRAVLELARALGEQRRAGEARVQLGSVLHLMARYEEALVVLEPAVALFQALGDLEGQAQALAEIAYAHARRGTPQEGIARVQPHLEPLTMAGLSAQGQASLYARLAVAMNNSSRFADQLRMAERALALARPLGDAHILAMAGTLRSRALADLGRIADAVSVLDEVIPLAESIGDLPILVHALQEAGLNRGVQGLFEQSRVLLERAYAWAEQLGDPPLTAVMCCSRGEQAFRAGTWHEARACYQQAAEALRSVRQAGMAPFLSLDLGQLALVEGEREQGLRLLREAVALAQSFGNLRALRRAHAALAEWEVLEGRPDAARARLLPLLDQPDQLDQLDQPNQQEADATALLPGVAWAYLALGDEAQAASLSAQSIARATASGDQTVLVDAWRVQALVALRRGDWEEAASALDEALRRCCAMPYPYAEAKALYVFGQLHQARGEPGLARERFTQALAILHRLGERLYADHIERALAEMKSG